MANRWIDAFKVYRDPHVIAVLFLGFSSGLPLLLTLSTLSLWLSREGVSLTGIGLFALVGLPYAIKFLWAPVIDRAPVPVLTRWLGRRRSWALVFQALLVVAIIGLGGSNPSEAPFATAAWALAVAFFSASQDVVLDAFRVDSLKETQQGAGAGVFVLGYRLGMLCAGAGALYVASVFDWFTAFASMAGLMVIGMATVLLRPEPAPPSTPEAEAREQRARDWLERRPHFRGRVAKALAWIHGAVIAPFAEFTQRPYWWLVLVFVLLYKYGDAIAGVMANPFYDDLGFTLAEIASVSKVFGLIATLVGGLLGGAMVNRLGILKSLMICGVLQAVSNLVFAVQAVVGHSVPMLMVTIAVENLSGGMGTAAFVAYLASLCNVAYTATQYALLSAIMSFGRTLLSASGGWMADHMDWVTFFVVTTFAALPGLALLIWMMKRFPGKPPPREPAPPAS